MDETPEELEQIRREAETIDPHKYRRRYRAMMTLLAVAFSVGVAWVAVHMAVASRNPCERIRNYYCRTAPNPVACASYQTVFKESVEEDSAKMRGVIRDQCLTKISRLKEEDGISVE